MPWWSETPSVAIAVDTHEVIRDKVEANERLEFEDGLALMESDDLLALGELADLARRVRGGGDEVYFVQNLYLNQTNVCRVKCKFCAFAATQKQEHAYTLTADELVEDALRQRELTGFTEIHMVNGESPHVGFDFYVDTVRALHEAMPDVHLKLYTASEIHHMTTISGLTHEEVLRELRDAGLGSLPGGGAEVFAERVRRLIAPGKESPELWLHTHRTAHGLGIPTHCTMLYGHVETYEERVEHLLTLRALQDETGGFLAFIPLAFHPENTVFERRGWKHTTGADDLKLMAVSRLLLDNIPNIKAYWIMMGMPMAQVALHFGANDVQGTVVREEIFHAAGARTETEQKIGDLVRFIRAAGRVPVQRDTLYNELCRWDGNVSSGHVRGQTPAVAAGGTPWSA
jgi:aminodeoxyfutalosine synthase